MAMSLNVAIPSNHGDGLLQLWEAPASLTKRPPSPREWLPENDLVYFVMDVAGQLNLAAITRVYEQSDRGFPPFHPRMMACLLIYSYSVGVRSSRQIAQRCERDAAFRVIVGTDIPDFRTISLFRKTHLQAFADLFVQVVQIAREAGLVKLGHLSLDGTKIKANASRHKAMSYGRMKQDEARLKQEIKDLLAQAQATDQEEDGRYGKSRGDELPKELSRRHDRLAKILVAKQALEERARQKQDEDGHGDEPVTVDDKAQYNFTDPESRIMKANNKGWDQSGNAQAVVDCTAQIIVAADVTDQANDMKQAEPMMEQAQQNAGETGEIDKVSMVMNNHWHFVVRPEKDGDLTAFSGFPGAHPCHALAPHFGVGSTFIIATRLPIWCIPCRRYIRSAGAFFESTAVVSRRQPARAAV